MPQRVRVQETETTMIANADADQQLGDDHITSNSKSKSKGKNKGNGKGKRSRTAACTDSSVSGKGAVSAEGGSKRKRAKRRDTVDGDVGPATPAVGGILQLCKAVQLMIHADASAAEAQSQARTKSFMHQQEQQQQQQQQQDHMADALVLTESVDARSSGSSSCMDVEADGHSGLQSQSQPRASHAAAAAAAAATVATVAGPNTSRSFSVGVANILVHTRTRTHTCTPHPQHQQLQLLQQQQQQQQQQPPLSLSLPLHLLPKLHLAHSHHHQLDLNRNNNNNNKHPPPCTLDTPQPQPHPHPQPQPQSRSASQSQSQSQSQSDSQSQDQNQELSAAPTAPTAPAVPAVPAVPAAPIVATQKMAVPQAGASSMTVVAQARLVSACTIALFASTPVRSIQREYRKGYVLAVPRHVALEQTLVRLLSMTRLSMTTLCAGLRLVAVLLEATPFGRPLGHELDLRWGNSQGGDKGDRADKADMEDTGDSSCMLVPPETLLVVVALSLADSALNDAAFTLRDFAIAAFAASSSASPLLRSLHSLHIAALAALDFRLCAVLVPRFAAWAAFCPVLVSRGMHLIHSASRSSLSRPQMSAVAVALRNEVAAMLSYSGLLALIAELSPSSDTSRALSSSLTTAPLKSVQRQQQQQQQQMSISTLLDSRSAGPIARISPDLASIQPRKVSPLTPPITPHDPTVMPPQSPDSRCDSADCHSSYSAASSELDSEQDRASANAPRSAVGCPSVFADLDRQECHASAGRSMNGPCTLASTDRISQPQPQPQPQPVPISTGSAQHASALMQLLHNKHQPAIHDIFEIDHHRYPSTHASS